MLELQTPFVFRRLPGANDEEEESLLLDQQPIFADDTFANTSVWATPKLGENSRSRPSPYLPVRNASTSEDVEHARDVYPSGGADDLAADCSFSFEQSTFIDRGQRTVLVGGADAARRRDSDHAKRGASSPEASGSSKRAKPRPSHPDDYYQRRLSRQSSSSTLETPPLPSLHLSLASSSGSSSRYPSGASSPASRSVFSGDMCLDPSDQGHCQPPELIELAATDTPLPRPSILSRFLARSSALHPPPVHVDHRNPSIDTDPLTEPAASSGASEDGMTERSIHRTPYDTSSSHHIEDSSHRSASTSIPRSESAQSLRRSTSQRVIGFFSDLLGTSTPARPVLVNERDGSEDGERDRSTSEYVHERILSPAAGSAHHGAELEHSDDDQPNGDETQQERAHSEVSVSTHRPATRPPSRAPAGFVRLTRPNRAFVSNTASRASNPIRHTDRPISSFTSAALARLPPPGKGASSAGERITVKPAERAANLQARRALFEKPQNGQSNPSSGMTRTVPLVGKTPGRASKARAVERRRFHRAEQDRIDDISGLHRHAGQRRLEDESRRNAASRTEKTLGVSPAPVVPTIRGVTRWR